MLERLSRQGDSHDLLLHRLGEVYFELGLWDEAADCFRRALYVRFEARYLEDFELASARSMREDLAKDVEAHEASWSWPNEYDAPYSPARDSYWAADRLARERRRSTSYETPEEVRADYHETKRLFRAKMTGYFGWRSEEPAVSMHARWQMRSA